MYKWTFARKIYRDVLTSFPNLKGSNELEEIIFGIVDYIYEENLEYKWLKDRFYAGFSYWGVQKKILDKESYLKLKNERIKTIDKCFIDSREKEVFNRETYKKYLLVEDDKRFVEAIREIDKIFRN